MTTALPAQITLHINDDGHSVDTSDHLVVT